MPQSAPHGLAIRQLGPGWIIGVEYEIPLSYERPFPSISHAPINE